MIENVMKSKRLIWPVVLLLTLVLSCNMPGWGEGATEIPGSTEEALGVAAAIDTPMPTEISAEAEMEEGIEAKTPVDDQPEEATETGAVFNPCSPLPPPSGT